MGSSMKTKRTYHDETSRRPKIGFHYIPYTPGVHRDIIMASGGAGLSGVHGDLVVAGFVIIIDHCRSEAGRPIL